MSSSEQVYTRLMTTLQAIVPVSNRKQLVNWAWIAVAIFQAKSIALSQIAVFLPGSAKAESRVMRLRRWLSSQQCSVWALYQAALTTALSVGWTYPTAKQPSAELRSKPPSGSPSAPINPPAPPAGVPMANGCSLSRASKKINPAALIWIIPGYSTPNASNACCWRWRWPPYGRTSWANMSSGEAPPADRPLMRAPGVN